MNLRVVNRRRVDYYQVKVLHDTGTMVRVKYVGPKPVFWEDWSNDEGQVWVPVEWLVQDVDTDSVEGFDDDYSIDP